MDILENSILLPTLISDRMVLQRNSRVRIWGKAASNEIIKLTFLKKDYTILVDTSGIWEIILDNLQAGGPYEMVIECCNVKKTLSDILVGDVWVLGGQSNMQIPVKRTLDLFEEEVKDAEYSEIRQFLVPQEYDFHEPQEELTGGSWVAVNPTSIYDFSAIGFFFARILQEKYKIPIGLLLTAIGGTPAEAWISEKTLMRFGKFQELLNLCKDDSYVNGTKHREELQNNCWYRELDEKDAGLHDAKGFWYKENHDDSEWEEMELPANFAGTKLETIKGSIWFRKEIEIPKSMLKGNAKLILGTIIDGDDTYINGVPVGNTGYLYPPRRYIIPEGLLKEGRNIIAVRVILTKNVGAFVTDMPYFIEANGEQVPISGTWKYHIGTTINAQGPTTFFQYKPTGVYNSMIYPLRRLNISGVLWYQGESNTDDPFNYKDLFEAVIKDWRATWNIGEFPFLYVQLANYCPWRQEPPVSGWARIREEQRKVLELAGTGMAVSFDVGNYNDLHPQNKKAVADRLALWASKIVYGEDIVCSGPIYDHMSIEGRTIKLYFKHVGSGLAMKGVELKTFEVCGTDGVYYAAEAVIDKDKVIVSTSKVKEPLHVRYAWADNPEEANLYNKEELPGSPFTTKL